MAVKIEIDTRELAWLTHNLKRTKEGMKDLRKLHKQAAQVILDEAKSHMPHQSGAFMRSWRAGATRLGGYVQSKLVYAGVIEYGGTVRWRSSGKYQRDVQGNVFMAKTHRIPVRPKAKSVGKDSYHIYPAIDAKQDEVAKLYEEGLHQLAEKYLGR